MLNLPIIVVGLLTLVGLVINYLLPKKYQVTVLKSKSILLGTLKVDELTILEWKPLFSLKTFYFNPGDAQEIFHTHSFAAYSLLLYGNYMERFYDLETKATWEEPRNRSRIIYIPRDRFHQITKCEGCRTIMLTGPWGDSYIEYKHGKIQKDDELIVSTHGRKELRRLLITNH